MGKSKVITSNLDVVRELCNDLEEFFEAFYMDRVWNESQDKVTVCFTAEKIKKRYMPN